MEYFIGSYNSSGITAKSFKDFVEYLKDEVLQRLEKGAKIFSITIEDEEIGNDFIGSVAAQESVDDVMNFNSCSCNLGNSNIIDAEFVSVWDGGNIYVSTPCKVNIDTHEVFDIGVSEETANAVNTLETEFIRFPDGSAYSVAELDADFWYK